MGDKKVINNNSGVKVKKKKTVKFASEVTKSTGGSGSLPNWPIEERALRVGGRGGGGEVSGASPGEAASGADLGGSNNYSNEIFED